MGENAGQSCHNVDHCPGYDPRTKQGAPTPNPFCDPCLDRHERDIRALLLDYLDLAQLHEPALSQAINEKASGSKDQPLLISAHVEALQAEIVHATTTWEYEIRVACRLSDPTQLAPTADWHTTLTRPTPIAQVRPGAAVQRAIGILGTRIDRLAKLPPTAVCLTGSEDTHEEIEGWEAVQHLSSLHSRARGMLGRTTRRFWIPGPCWACTARPVDGVDGPLYRSEPRFEGDPMQVNCDKCHASRVYADYEKLIATLEWPQPDTTAPATV